MSRAAFRPPPDPALPGLERAAHPGTLKILLRQPLAELLDGPAPVLQKVQVAEFHLKPGINCRIAYRLFLENGREMFLSGKVLPPFRRLGRDRGKHWRRIPDLNLVLRLPSADRALPHLSLLLDPENAVEECGWIFPESRTGAAGLRPKDIRIDLLRYRPDRRALVRMQAVIRSPEGRTHLTRYIKIYHRPLPPGRLETARRLGEGPEPATRRTPMPPVTGTSRDARVLVSDAVRGALLPDAENSLEEEALRNLARTLRAVHNTPSVIEAVRGPEGELKDLESCRKRLEIIDAGLGAAADGLTAGLVRRIFDLPDWRYRTIHGDFSYEQVLFRGKKCRILDPDLLASGDPQIDLGSFSANCLEAALSGRISRETAGRWILAFLRSYQLLAPADLCPAGLRWFTAACLLRLAGRPLRRAEPGWRQRARLILAEGERVLRGERDRLFPPSLGKKPEAAFPDLIREELNIPEEGSGRPETGLPMRLKKVWPQRGNNRLLLYENFDSGTARKRMYRCLGKDVPGDPVWFPRDRRLSRLRDAVDPEHLQRILRDANALPATAPTGRRIREIKVAGYKPERRCQLKITLRTPGRDDSGTELFVKLYRRRGEAETAAANWEFVRTGPAAADDALFLPLPEARVLPELKAMALPRLPGRDFFSLLTVRPENQTAERIGRALRAWQAGGAASGVSHTWIDELEVLKRWAAAAGDVFPVFAATLERRIGALRDKAAALPPSPTTLIHRDFYDKQVLIHQGRIAILDLDTAAEGDPALDAGNFSAHLVLRGLQKHGNPAAFQILRNRFLEGWKDRGNPSQDKWVEIYTACSLLRLACVYTLRPGGRALFFPLLRAAG